MKSVLHPADREALQRRLAALEESSKAEWGKMTVGEMVCHLGDQIRLALGQIGTADQSSWVSRQILKRLVLWGMPAPKGKVDTLPEINQEQGQGTRPTGFEADREQTRQLLADFLATAENDLHAHSMMGPLTKAQWARMIYVHMDHHLQQFGV